MRSMTKVNHGRKNIRLFSSLANENAKLAFLRAFFSELLRDGARYKLLFDRRAIGCDQSRKILLPFSETIYERKESLRDQRRNPKSRSAIFTLDENFVFRANILYLVYFII